MLLRIVAILLLIGASGAAAQTGLRVQYLGVGSEHDAPGALAGMARTDAAPGLIDDTGGGSWWRAQVAGDGAMDTAAAGLPEVLVFKAGYSARLLLLDPVTGWRVERDRSRHTGPDWSARTDLLVVLPAALQQGRVFYIHVDDPSQRRIRPLLLPLDHYLASNQRRHDAAIASAAVLLTLALLAVAFVGAAGAAAYRYLAVMACLCAGYVLGLNGDLYSLLGIDAVERHGVLLQRVFGMLAPAFSYFFIIAFLRLRARQRHAARVLTGLAWLQIGLVALSALQGTQPPHWGATLSNLLILASIPLVLWEAAQASRAGLRAGHFVLWAWGPVLLVLVLWIAALQDWLPHAAVDLGALVSFGLAIQVAVLVLGLADDSARLRSERDRATDAAERDPLTDILNRRALQSRIQALIERSGSEAAAISLIYFDIDHFKRINDQYGHAVGDACLRAVVKRVSREQRANDVLARIGGEEFVILLPALDGHGAAAHAERLRHSVSREPLRIAGHSIAITVSFGVAAWRSGETAEAWLHRADQAQYRAKTGGRNRVVLADRLPET